MNIDEQFALAQTESKSLSEKPDNETLLKLYSLFKQGSNGDAPNEGPSNPFDIVGKAKFQAWTSLKGISQEEAKKKYIELVASLKD